MLWTTILNRTAVLGALRVSLVLRLGLLLWLIRWTLIRVITGRELRTLIRVLVLHLLAMVIDRALDRIIIRLPERLRNHVLRALAVHIFIDN